ncbi:MAG TPA: glycosyltransferase family 4 protein [Fimbriimonadaceae bacterium]|nr:glycosyltransferase family 4 protein [Fimbriimonadaceae bacterium]
MRITFVLRPDAYLVRGGAEIQFEHTKRELEALGHSVDVLTSLSTDVGDVVHFFGTWESHWLAASQLLRRGIPYVCSPIYTSTRTPSAESLRRRRRALLGNSQKYLTRLFAGANDIICLTSLELKRVEAAFNVPSSKFSIIPNGVDPRFAAGDPVLFRAHYGVQEDFVLHCGSIYPDKNQVRLAQALQGTGIRLICLGPTFEPEYRKQLEELEVAILDPIPSESNLLPGAYAAARVFCLPSKFEVFSLAALEAAAAGCGLVLSNTWGAEEHFDHWAEYVDYRSVDSIRGAVERKWAERSASSPEAGEELMRQSQRSHFIEKFSWPSVAKQLLAIYSRYV